MLRRSLWLLAVAVCLAAWSQPTAAQPAVEKEPDHRAGVSELVEFVDGRVERWRIQPEDRQFDAIGWATELLEARKLAREHGRPVFVFTHDGRMAVGRC